MIIERFEKFSKKLNEYNYPSESTIVPKLKELYDFKEHKNYKYAVLDGCPEWDIMVNKGYFYSTLENNKIYFIFDDGEPIAYYADPLDEAHFGYIVDCDNKKYSFENNHSFLELYQKFPTLQY